MQTSSGDTSRSAANANWSRVAVLASAVDANLDKWLVENYRLGLTEFRALTLLSQAADKELRVQELAQRIGLNPSSTTRLVSRLEVKRLARRDTCPDDGRGVYAVIDPEGETLIRDLGAPLEAHLQDLMARPSVHFPHLDTPSTVAALAAVGALLGD